ncbi:MAG: CHAP domain-containing protein [Actinomycetota bacterium]|nr:CHAP domain-containing protein [Actinomycetota bacterium]
MTTKNQTTTARPAAQPQDLRPTNSLGEVEPSIPDPHAGRREGEPDPGSLDQQPTRKRPPQTGDRGLPPSAGQVLNRATQFLGFKEGSNNDTPFGAWYGLNHQPYCDMFVSYVFHQEGGEEIGGHFAFCPSHVQWFKQRGQWGSSPQRGAVVFFTWDGGPSADHVGLVESVGQGGWPHTVEANTSSGEGGSQGNGDGVYRRVRNPRFVLGYGYPAYGVGAAVISAATVSLARVMTAATLDGPRPQGVGTPGSEVDVRVVEQALVGEHLLDPSLVDGAFGTSTVAAYAAWQRQLGFTGADADGIPGRDSLVRLGAAHGFAVTD